MSTMETYRLDAAGCPVCLQKLDAASNGDADSRAPETGDVTVCLYCGAALEWDADMHLAQLSRVTRASLGPGELRQLARLSIGIALQRILNRNRSK